MGSADLMPFSWTRAAWKAWVRQRQNQPPLRLFEGTPLIHASKKSENSASRRSGAAEDKTRSPSPTSKN